MLVHQMLLPLRGLERSLPKHLRFAKRLHCWSPDFDRRSNVAVTPRKQQSMLGGDDADARWSRRMSWLFNNDVISTCWFLMDFNISIYFLTVFHTYTASVFDSMRMKSCFPMLSKRPLDPGMVIDVVGRLASNCWSPNWRTAWWLTYPLKDCLVVNG